MMELRNGGDVTDINIDSVPGQELVGDLTMTEATNSVFYGGARIGFAPVEFVYSTFAVDSTQDSNMSAGGTFFGQPLGADFSTTTDLDISLNKLMMGMDLFNSGVFRVGLMVGVDELNFSNFSLTTEDGLSDGMGGFLIAPGTSQTIVSDEKLLVPMGGLRADVYLPLTGLRLGGEYSGISIDVDDAAIEYWDLDVNLNYALMKNVEILAGFRDVTLDISGNLDGAQMTAALGFDGPYLAVGILF